MFDVMNSHVEDISALLVESLQMYSYGAPVKELMAIPVNPDYMAS